MIKVLGYAAKHSFTRLTPMEIEHAAPGPNDVQIDVLYCGMASPKRELEEAA